MNNEKPSNTLGITFLVVLLAIGVVFWFGSSGNNAKKEIGIQTIITTTPQKEDINTNPLFISKERFDYYNEAFLNLSKLQSEYEQIYAKFGMVDLEAAKKIPEGADFPQYGSVTNKVSIIYNNLPKFNLDMSPGEKFLVFQAANYGAALIFLTPGKNNLEGIDFASGKKKIIEDALKEVKDSNKF